MSRVVVVGSFNVDHVWTTAMLPRPGETLGGRYATGPGGKGFNQAVACARSGARTTFICALGDDPGGQLARALAADDGIDLRDLHSTEPTGTAGIYVDAEGRNSIVIGAGANAALSAGHVDAQLESPTEAIAAALLTARARGAIALLNPAPANAPTTRDLLALADVTTPNETEFAGLVSRHVGERLDGDAVASLDQPHLHALCRDLLPAGTVVVTLGASGCFVSHADDALRGDDRAFYRLGAEQVRVVDSTGAGDAFNGAIAAAMAGAPDAAFAGHLRFASRYAALSTEREGAALAMPRREEVAARFGG
ncbi:MAG TPA: ribokinase [Luteimonas sp.]